MTAYFLRAKAQLCCRMGPGFIHNFQEMTYLKPTFCEHCAGFVSLCSPFSCREGLRGRLTSDRHSPQSAGGQLGSEISLKLRH